MVTAEKKFVTKSVMFLNPITKRFDTKPQVILESKISKYPPARCDYCSEIFPKKRKDQRFCNDICRMKWWIREQHNGKEPDYGDANCVICDVIFHKTRPWHKYCCDDCRAEARKRKLVDNS